MPTHRMTRGNQCRVVLLGNTGVGKTSLATQFMEGYFPEQHMPTLLDCMRYSEEVDGTTYAVEIVDCAADKAFAEHRSPYIETADVIVLVYSMADGQSLVDLREHVEEVVRVRQGGLETVPKSDARLLDEGGTPNPLSKSPAAAASVGGSKRGSARHDDRISDGGASQDPTSSPTTPRVPYRREVPIFVVGTHADVVGRGGGRGSSKTKPVTREQAEAVTEACLCRVGLMPSTGKLDSDGSKVSGKLQNMWNSIRKKLDGDERRGRGSSRSPRDGGDDSKRTGAMTPTSPQSVEAEAAAAVPPGASNRLPLYELSAKDPRDVWQLFQAVVRLHVFMSEPFRAVACGSPQSPGLYSGNQESAMGLSASQPHCRTLSTSSSSRNAGGAGVGAERPPTPRLPSAGSLYNLAAADLSFQKHERTLSQQSTTNATQDDALNDDNNCGRGEEHEPEGDSHTELPDPPLKMDATAAYTSLPLSPLVAPKPSADGGFTSSSPAPAHRDPNAPIGAPAASQGSRGATSTGSRSMTPQRGSQGQDGANTVKAKGSRPAVSPLGVPSDATPCVQRADEGGDADITIHSPPQCSSTQVRPNRHATAEASFAVEEAHPSRAEPLTTPSAPTLSKRGSKGTRLDLDDVTYLDSSDDDEVPNVTKTAVKPSRQVSGRAGGTGCVSAPGKRSDSPSTVIEPSAKGVDEKWKERNVKTIKEQHVLGAVDDTGSVSPSTRRPSQSPKPSKSKGNQCSNEECTIM